MKTQLSQWLCAAFLSASLPLARGVEPCLSFDFNAGSGTSAYGAKSNPAELVMLSATSEPISLYGENGSGLTGKPGDFALDIGRTTQAMGADGRPGGFAKLQASVQEIGAPTSFTVTGWLKAASKLGGAARILEYNDPLGNGFFIYCGGPGVLSLSMNKMSANTPLHSDNCFRQTPESQWVFFAVAYDGSKSVDNVTFYGGTPAAEPGIIATESLDAGKVGELNRYGCLTIGNNSTGIRPFHGMIDNIAIYCSASDGTGAVSPRQIQEIYQANLAAVPSEQTDAGHPLKIALVGDSTVCEYPNDSPLRGWGQMLRQFTAPGVLFVNEAEGGRSSKTFPAVRWQKILAYKPDFVFIQFGHNDAHGAGQPESTDAATDYRENLRRYVNEARSASIVPVLVTPPHRRLFAGGHLTSELAAYAGAMKAVAEELHVPLIDLHEKSGKWLEQLGEEGSSPMTVNRGPNPASDDRSHFTKEGATTLTKLVTETFSEIDPRLGNVLGNH
jgi:lysophospholipase L1-like esterase